MVLLVAVAHLVQSVLGLTCMCDGMLARWYDFFPLRQALVLRQGTRARTAMVNVFMDVASRVEALEV